MVALLWFILLVLLAVWLVGLLLDIAGGFIHILLIVALVLLIWNLFSSRRGARY
ncbi:MAG: lmo0937 family membrane protein [Dehalococcoidia bacterium]